MTSVCTARVRVVSTSIPTAAELGGPEDLMTEPLATATDVPVSERLERRRQGRARCAGIEEVWGALNVQNKMEQGTRCRLKFYDHPFDVGVSGFRPVR